MRLSDIVIAICGTAIAASLASGALLVWGMALALMWHGLVECWQSGNFAGTAAYAIGLVLFACTPFHILALVLSEKETDQ